MKSDKGKPNEEMNPRETLVKVRRQWNDWRIATYRLSSLNGFHRDIISGGVGMRAPFESLYAYASCDSYIDGEIAHSGLHGDCPHNIKVVILKVDNKPKSFYEKIKKYGLENKSRERKQY